MRFFIALEIPDACKDQIKLVQRQLAQTIPNIRVTDSKKLHLTIAFIGEQDDNIKQPLTEVIKNSVKEIEPFTVTPAYIDGFPELHHAKVLWIGVKGDIDKLMVIRERVKDGLVKSGLEADERRYVPHITIAKTDHFTITPDQERKLQEIMMSKFSPIFIDAIKLFESIPQEGSHHHNTLAEVPLKTNLV